MTVDISIRERGLDIKLNFINQSNDQNNSQIVIVQKNAGSSFDELTVAWTVIENCGQGDNHPFTYPMASTVGASDSYGNFTPQMVAQDGQLFHMVLTGSGDSLQYAGPATSPEEIQIRNDLPKGAINANVFKSGRLLATKTSVAPGQQAVFAFKPIIWIGAVSQVEQGKIMNSAILSAVNTEISLMGIVSADIVMTGGGPGVDSTPFMFTLANVVMA